MQGESGKSVNKESSWASPASEWATGTADEQGVYPWKLDVVDKDVILADEAAMENGSVREADVSLSNYVFQEDEMMSWLRYPLDDSFEKNYCSDFFGDLPNPNVQLLRDSFPYQSGKEHGNASGTAGSTIRSNISHAAGLLGSSSKEEHGLVSTVSSADAAMALGAGRAAGLIPPASAEAEAFNKVRTSMQPSICKSARLSKRKTPGSPPNQILAPSERPFATNPPSSQNLKAADISQACKSPSQLAKPGSTKNAHRSSHPAAPTKPKSHVVGVRQQYGNLGLREGSSTHGDSSAEGSITTALSGIGSCKEADLKSLAHKSNQCTVARRWQLPTSPLSRQEADLITCKKLEQDDCFHSSNSASVVTATDKASETLGMPELAITSTSMGSGSSLDRSGKETASSSKRKMMSQGDDSEYQSEDAGDIAPNSKMPVEGRPCTTKRNRAAEIHNLSERRRRDRINEKMKALQRLIPNANKTDKASMLDEAIEYLKLLQSQIQLMSMRTGVGIPQMIPTGLQHLQMQQMPHLPHVGVGMGMGVGLAMGMGIGMMDPGVPTPGHPIVPFQLLPGRMPPGPSNYATGFQPSTSSLKAHDAHKNQERAGMVESHNTYLAHQQLQPMQMDVNMHTEMNMYNALMEQQQPQQRQRHQSQQAEGNCISKRVW